VSGRLMLAGTNHRSVSIADIDRPDRHNPEALVWTETAARGPARVTAGPVV
jgi:hypothetical protein